MRPKTLSAALVLFLFLCLGLSAWSAPAPNEDLAARTKLEGLKKKLSPVLVESINKSDRWAMKYEASIRSMRRVGSTEAKLTILMEAISTENNGTPEKAPQFDEVIVIYLTFYDGAWTTRRFEGSWGDNEAFLRPAAGAAGGAGGGGGRAGGVARVLGSRNSRGAKFLMAAIDELSETKE